MSKKTYISQLAIWNKGNLHSFPNERLTLFHKKQKKASRKPKGKFPAMFSQVLKRETLLLRHISYLCFLAIQTAQSFYSSVFPKFLFLCFQIV
jgi:hypothetical protein